MYLSIRDAILHQLGESMGEKENLLAGLNFLNLNALEMERWERLSSEGTSEKVDLFNSSERDMFAEQLDKNGIKVSAFLMHNDFSNPAVAEEIDWILKCIEVSKSFGIQIIRLDPAMRQKGLPIKEAAGKNHCSFEKSFG